MPELAEVMRWVLWWGLPAVGIVCLVQRPVLQRWIGWLALYLPILGSGSFIEDLLGATTLFALVEWLYHRARVPARPTLRRSR